MQVDYRRAELPDGTELKVSMYANGDVDLHATFLNGRCFFESMEPV